MTRPLEIVACGAVTAVGFTAAQTCAAIRAGISGYRETGFFEREPELAPIIGAPAGYDELPYREPLPQRLARLASDTIADCSEARDFDPARTALLLVLPGPERQLNTHVIVRALVERAGKLRGKTFHPASAVIAEGSAAVGRCLLRAGPALDDPHIDAVLVVGVDSYLNGPDLEHLRQARRIKGEEVTHGLIPGEAGAALLVVRAGGGDALATCRGVGVRNHDGLPDAGRRGRTLLEALRAAIGESGLAEADVAFRIADLTGEYEPGLDSALAGQRFYRTRREELPVILTGNVGCGAVGAAGGVLEIVVAAHALAKSYAPGPVVMCEAASESSLRSACLLIGASTG